MGGYHGWFTHLFSLWQQLLNEHNSLLGSPNNEPFDGLENRLKDASIHV
jgi:hypothetical protein